MNEIQDLWWEGDTLYVQNKDGTVWAYKGAYITSHTIQYEDNDIVKVGPVEVGVTRSVL